VIWSKYDFSINLLSSSSYFHNKNPFSISFIRFKLSLDWASINGKRRGLGVKLCRHREQWRWMAGWFLVSAGVLLKNILAEGVSTDLCHPI
jgi:hypothetical protein